MTRRASWLVMFVRHDEVDGSVMLGRGRAPHGAVVLLCGRLELLRGAEHGCDVDWRARWFCDHGLWFAARRCVGRVWLARCLPLVQFLPRWFPDPDLTQELEDASKNVLPVATGASEHRKHWPMVGRQSFASFLSLSCLDLRDASLAFWLRRRPSCLLSKYRVGTVEWQLEEMARNRVRSSVG